MPIDRAAYAAFEADYAAKRRQQQETQPVAPPEEDYSLAGDLALAPLRGVEGAAQDVVSLGYKAADFLTGDNLPDHVGWASADEGSRALGESRSTVGKLIEGATNFAVGFIPAAGLLKGAALIGEGAELAARGKTLWGISKSGLIAAARNTAAGAIADATVFDGHDQRLSNILEQFPALQNPVTDFLSAKKDDNAAEARLKNALEGAGIGLAVGELFRLGLKGLKAARKVLAGGGTLEEAIAAQEAAAPAKKFQIAYKKLNDQPGFESFDSQDVFTDIRTNPDKGGHTFNWDGSTYVSPAGAKEDTVTLASVNVPLDRADGTSMKEFLAQYPEMANIPNTKPGAFKLDVGADGKQYASLDLNVVVDQAHRENSKLFAQANNQQAIWDNVKGEPVPTGGTGDTVLKSPADIAAAAKAISEGKPFDFSAVAAKGPQAAPEAKVASAAAEGAAPKAAPLPEELAAEPATVQKRARILRDIGVDESRLKQLANGTIHVENRYNAAGIPLNSNPRNLSAIEKLSVGLDDQQLNFAHIDAPDNVLGSIRKYEEVFKSAMEEDTATLNRPQTWRKLQADGLRAYQDLIHENNGDTAWSKFMLSLEKDTADGPAATAKLWGRIQFIYDYSASLQRDVNSIGSKAMTEAERTAAQLQLLQRTDLFANALAGVKGQIAQRGRELGMMRMSRRLIANLDPAELKKLVAEAGGIENVTGLADKIKAVLEGSGAPGLTKLVNNSAWARGSGMAMEFWINALLSGGKTITTNGLGGAMFSIWRPVELMGGALLSGNSREFKIAAREAWNLKENIGEAFRLAKATAATGSSVLQKGHEVIDTVGRTKAAITAANAGVRPDSWAGHAIDWIGKGVRFPGTLLNGTDQFFKQLNYRAVARAELMQDALDRGLTPRAAASEVFDKMTEMIDNGQAYSRETVYNKGLKLAETKLPPDATAFDKSEWAARWASTDVAKGGGWNPKLGALSTKALSAADDVAFTKPINPNGNLLEAGAAKLQSLAISHPLMRMVTPFVAVPTNIALTAGQRFPFISVARTLASKAMPKMYGEISESQTRFIADILSKDSRKAAEALGRMGTGMGVIGALSFWAADGTITGRGPSDPEQRQILQASGWLPYSFKVGDGYVSYIRLDPFATVLGLVADTLEYSRWVPTEDQNKVETQMFALATAVANNFTNKSYLTGIQNVVDALQEPDRRIPKFMQNYVKSVVPGVVDQSKLPLSGDGNMRDIQGFLDALRSRVPGLSDTLPPVRNIMGEPVKRVTSLGSDTAAIFDAFLPIAYREVSDDTVRQELANLKHGFTPPIAKQAGIDLRDYTSNKGQTAYDRWGELQGTVTIGGKTMRQALKSLIASPTYQRIPIEGAPGIPSPRIEMVSTLIQKYQQEARIAMLKDFPQIKNLELQLRATRRDMKTGVNPLNLKMP